MNTPDINKAWETLVARKGKRTEDRTAFITALIMDRVRTSLDEGDLPVTAITPSMAEAFAVEFTRLARRIKALAEHDCNYGLNERQERESEKLQARFGTLARALGFEGRTGGDPRGACAYLIDPDNRSEGDGWGDGWAIYS